MGKIVAGIATSHVPAVGHAVDAGKENEPYWAPMFEGYEFSKQWAKDNPADVDIIVYNDHASYFGMEIMPTFAMGIADNYAICDEGYGRPGPPGARARISPRRVSRRAPTFDQPAQQQSIE